MDMNAFRQHLAKRAEEQGEDNKPRHRAFGADLDTLKAEAYSEKSTENAKEELEEAQYKAGKATGKGTTSKDLDPNKKEEEKKEEYSLTGRDIVEAFEIVNFFCESIMEEHGLNEESEDIDAIIEEALNLLDLDEDYGKMPTVSQGLSDDEKKKVQKGEKSQMPTAGIEDKLPGEQQSSIDAIKAVLGSKKGSAAGSAY